MASKVTVRALGTSATAVVADADALLGARSIPLRDLRALDLAASRFRNDSELQAANQNDTGYSVRSPWATVTVAAGSCLDANAASTASIVLGERAPDWLAQRHLPARPVRLDGSVVRVAGWPDAEKVAA